jgi:5'-3' exonuclease
MKSLKLLGIDKQVTVIGIAKRLEELYYPGDQYPMYLDKRSETLKVIQQLRDEAHRFGITFHRKKRDKGTLATELELIEGIGKTTAEKLLKYFKSVKKIREATETELQEVVNLKQAKAITQYFNPAVSDVTGPNDYSVIASDSYYKQQNYLQISKICSIANVILATASHKLRLYRDFKKGINKKARMQMQTGFDIFNWIVIGCISKG